MVTATGGVPSSREQQRRVLRAMWMGGSVAVGDRSLAAQVARMPGADPQRRRHLWAGAIATLGWFALLILDIFFGHGAARWVGVSGSLFILLMIAAGFAVRLRMRRTLRKGT